MDHVLTLVTPPNGLEASILALAEAALREGGAQVGPAASIQPATAVDLPFTGLSVGDAEASVRSRLGDAPFDLLAQATAQRSKRLFVADLESTIIANEMLDEMAVVAGCGERVADITARAMAGELDFEQSLAARVGLFQDQPTSLLEQATRSIRVNPGAEALITGLRARGVVTALVTGGFHVFADPIARRLGFDHVFANRLEIDGDRLTGKALAPVIDRAAKRTTLLRLCDQLGIGPYDAIAIGDGANDLAMIDAAGLGIAYRAKPAVYRAADARINHTGLDTTLYFLGS